MVLLGQTGRLAGNGVSPVGPTIEPLGQWPLHMGGVDINYLRLHDQHLWQQSTRMGILFGGDRQ